MYYKGFDTLTQGASYALQPPPTPVGEGIVPLTGLNDTIPCRFLLHEPGSRHRLQDRSRQKPTSLRFVRSNLVDIHVYQSCIGQVRGGIYHLARMSTFCHLNA